MERLGGLSPRDLGACQLSPDKSLQVLLWGKETRSATPTWPFASWTTRHQTAQMLWSIRYQLLCRLLRLLVRWPR